MAITAVFIDGAYLQKVLQHDHNRAAIDYGLLVKEMVEADELLRAYYYDCLPYQSNPPTEDEAERYGRRRRFFDALGYIPRFEVRQGKVVYRGQDHSGNPVYQQKGVDLMLGVDMALLAGKGRIAKVALLSGDSDFTPAVQAVKQEGVLTTLWHGGLSSQTRPSTELFQKCDERRELTADLIRAIHRRD